MQERITLQFKRKRKSNEGKDRLQKTSITGNKNKKIKASPCQRHNITIQFNLKKKRREREKTSDAKNW